MTDETLHDLAAQWPAEHVALVVVRRTTGVGAAGPVQVLASIGDLDLPFPLASVTKLLTATAMLVAIEEGAVTLDDACGPPGATLRHLLSHASGIAPDDDTVLAPPGRRRIYSNRGIELAAAHLEAQASIPFGDYLREAVLDPLGMTTTALLRSPAAGASGSAADLTRWVGEMLSPSLVAPTTVADAITPQFPELDGVLPGFGTQRPNPWGLGIEIRGTKHPHWTGSRNSPGTFGHFGQSGTFVWVDPAAGVGMVGLGDRPFGDWAVDLWPRLADAALRLGAAVG